MFQAFKVILEAQSMDKKKSLARLDYYAEVEREIQLSSKPPIFLTLPSLICWTQARATSFQKSRQEWKE